MKRVPISVLVAIVRRRCECDEVLLLHRVPECVAFWQPVTGSIRPGEPLRGAAIRETAEETGIREFERLVDLGLSIEFDIVPSRLSEYEPGVTRNREHVFAMRVIETAEVTLSAEHDAFAWLAFDAAIERVGFDENRTVLRRVREACDREEI